MSHPGSNADDPTKTGQPPDGQPPDREAAAPGEAISSPTSLLRDSRAGALQLNSLVDDLSSGLNEMSIESPDELKVHGPRAVALQIAGDAKTIDQNLETFLNDLQRAAAEKNAAHDKDIKERRWSGILNYFISPAGVFQVIPAFSANDIHTRLMQYRAASVEEEDVRRQAANFHNCLVFFYTPIITARMISNENHVGTQMGTPADRQALSVSPFFREGTFDSHLKQIHRNQDLKQTSAKQKFITTINIYIGYNVLNDIVKESCNQARSSAPDDNARKKGPGNPKAKEKAGEIKRLRKAVEKAGGNISHNTLKTYLALGEVWSSCIEPYKEGVWEVLPIFEFFNQLLPKNTSPDKIPKAYVKVLFDYIMECPPLYRFLVEACDKVDHCIDNDADNKLLSYYQRVYSKQVLVENEPDWSFLARATDVPEDNITTEIASRHYRFASRASRIITSNSDYKRFTKGVH